MHIFHTFYQRCPFFTCIFSLIASFSSILIATMGIADEAPKSTATYQFERMWPKLEQPWYFSWPTDVAVDKKGNVYIADSANYRIQKFTAEGAFITMWGSYGANEGQFIEINKIALDQDGNLYVTDSGAYRVQKFSTNGDFITAWGEYGYDDAHFQSSLNAITIDRNGFVYVGDYYRIQKFTNNGEFIAAWRNDASDNENKYFYGPSGLAISPDGFLYIADARKHRIQKFTVDGEFIDEWGKNGSGEGQFWSIEDIEIGSDGSIYIVDSGKHAILVFDSDGTFLHEWGENGSGPNQFNSPMGIGLDRNENLYVADKKNDKIQIYNTHGKFLTHWGSNGSTEGSFNNPYGLTIDNEGNVFVCDTYNHRIQKFNSNGQFVNMWGSEGENESQFNLPEGIAIDSRGDVFVADTNNHRIQKFTNSGDYLLKWGEYGLAGTYEYVLTDEGYEYKFFYDQNNRLGYFFSPIGITIDANGFVYVLEYSNSRVQVFDLDGQFITNWGSMLDEESYYDGDYVDGELYYPQDIIHDPKGYIYIADTELNRIEKYLPGGGFLDAWGYLGTENGNLKYPAGVCVDKNGDIYVADTDNHRIQKFSSEGEFISAFGSKGSSPGDFNGPTDIAVSAEGKIYVADSWNHRIQVFSQKDYTSDIKKAIIVAGGGDYQGNTLWGATQMCANYAYRALIYQGFDKQTIHYLSSDTDLDIDSNGEADDIDSDATNANLQNALIHWAKDADELVLYITDHGGDGSFRMTDTELLQASDLNTWLDQLQAIKNASVVVIYDACQSGSFLPILATSETPNRVVISSAQKDEPAYFTSAGALSFSYFFWGNIFNGMTVGNAFFSARNSTRYAYSNQSPLLDDNGNGIGNEDDDGIAARDIHIGNGVVSADDLPVIGSPVPTRHLYGESSVTLSVSDVTDAGGISRVWATLTPPDREIADPSIPILDIEIIDFALTDDNRYEGEVKGLSATGTYTLALFAKDKNNTISLPIPTQIIQHGSTDNKVPYSDEDLTLFIPSLRYESSCFSLTLRLSSAISTDNSLVWYHGSSLLLQDTCPPNSPWMNDTMQITIPEFECMDDVYRFRLNNYLNPTDPFRDYWTLDESSIELTN